ncbi:tyrosine-protein phosphatase [Actinocorallia sp. A-T 12471]|uniref:tyrosine-protein phosphatase n=1 Tax=Actinocorallia sp. A-T 12471 TaxID=3089813 RepID=UPI0029D39284|nr:tyrosine-protein phosphatase [Actinocorallia sp. A-T 12471]MDX6741410.1 tyrosine-protein phosphatase [Actinocorallia sp. A-T 12471]
MADNGGLSLGLETAPNARDLGGYATADGRAVRPGLVLRTEALHQLSDADIARLRALGVRDVVDFRGAPEIAMSGEDLLPDGTSYHHLPVVAEDHDIYALIAPLVIDPDPELQRRTLADGRAEAIMVDLYRWFVTDAEAREPFARALSLVERAETPVLFHCTAGKDRTGWMAALLLTALDVPRETIMADYLLTNERQANLTDLFKGRASPIDPALLAPLLDVRAPYLEAAFDQAEKDHGSVEDFLTDALGADPDRLRSRLLT